MEYVIPEKEVQKNAKLELEFFGVFCWRNNTGMIKIKNSHNGESRYVKTGTVGSCDLIGALPDGRFIGCEVKRPGERPSEDQIAFMRRMIDMNAVCFWVDDAKLIAKIMPTILAGGRVLMDEKGGQILEVK